MTNNFEKNCCGQDSCCSESHEHKHEHGCCEESNSSKCCSNESSCCSNESCDCSPECNCCK